ncbi:hypothetical protein GGR52DRAFT_18308 [Hypoxylon sp. FL1284]|nr:hypothetical protein GGR52DRAFT_18308 [Hypoxylon sp. FL1284]
MASPTSKLLGLRSMPSTPSVSSLSSFSLPSSPIPLPSQPPPASLPVESRSSSSTLSPPPESTCSEDEVSVVDAKVASANANPPSLPPTVEEAYRRKCIQLKERTKEIQEESKAYQLRIQRLERQIQKTRLERAFLLEQIQKRTSTNVEDSEGSPSPPPTPKDKPLRTKRGHRKPSLLPVNEPGSGPNATFVSQNLNTLSPSSDAFSHSQLDQKDHGGGRPTNGMTKRPKRPSNAFEIYCNDTRPVLQAQHKDKIAAGEFRLEEELARGWKDLPEKEKEEFQIRYEQELAQYKEAVEEYKRGTKGSAARSRSRGGDAMRASRGGRSARIEAAQDDDADEAQDVEMADLGDAEAGAGDADTDPETELEVDEHADYNDDTVVD